MDGKISPDEIYEKSICLKKETALRKEEESKLDTTNCPKWPKIEKPESDRVHSLLFNFYIFSMRWFKIWLTWPRLSGVLFSCGGFDILWPWRLELWPACRRFLRPGPSVTCSYEIGVQECFYFVTYFDSVVSCTQGDIYSMKDGPIWALAQWIASPSEYL